MRIILIGRGKMGTLIRETAAAAGDAVQVAPPAAPAQLLESDRHLGGVLLHQYDAAPGQGHALQQAVSLLNGGLGGLQGVPRHQQTHGVAFPHRPADQLVLTLHPLRVKQQQRRPPLAL